MLPQKATTASVDRRVENLEQRVADLSTDVALVKTEQAHIKELMSLQFKSLEATLGTLVAKVETLTVSLNAAARSDATADALAVVRTAEFAAVKTAVTEHETWIVTFKGALKGIDTMRNVLIGGGVVTFFLSAIATLHALGFIG
jgi:hypothetical protein